MRLKRLEISGFKTFREKVLLEFSPGVSGIIGPNGCGKSNIVDAIRWVMGEQRVKAIRGKKMDDVIFNGSETAAPVGMAEVTMTMVSDAQPFSGPYGDCQEVTVARRIFREGESEYYLNKVSCRLLDIKEFFMDTGIGARTYSLVEQNSVSTLVEAKPEDRRQFIEEAAGIAKYKSRKEAAIRKLEATTQNLTRLRDIIKEVKTQLNTVSRQAKRAEQYRALKKEIKDAELTLALVAYGDLKEKKGERENELAHLQEQETTLRTSLKSQEASFEDMKITVMEAEEIISRRRERLYEAKTNLSMKEQALEFSQKTVTELRAQKDRGVCEIAARSERLKAIHAELKQLASQNADLARESHDLQATLAVGQQKLAELKQAENNSLKELETRKGAYVDIAAEKAKLKNMAANLGKALEDIGRRKERHLKEIAESAARSEFLLKSLEDIAATLKNHEEESEALKQQQGARIDELGEAKTIFRKLEENIASLKDQRGRKTTRLTSLLEFQEGYSWCSEGIKTLMKAKKQANIQEMAGASNVALGLVADHIDVPREYEMAVESILGEKLQYVVVRNHDDGVNAIDYLKQSAAGRGSFIPLEVKNNHPLPSLVRHLEETVRLLDYVRVDDEFKEIMIYLLGDVLLIPNLKTGLALWRQNGFCGSFVTPEGDIINPQGILTGGSRAKGERSLLANKREIAELKQETARLTSDLEEAESRKKKDALFIASSEEELQQIKAALHQLELQINNSRKDRERFEEEMKRLNQRHSVMEFDHETVVLSEIEAREKTEGVKEELLIQDKREMLVSEEIAVLNAKRESAKAELERCERDYNAGKVLLASHEEKAVAGSRAIVGLESARAALLKEISDKQVDQEKAVHQEASLAKQIVADREALAGLYQELGLLEKSLADLQVSQQGKEELLKSREREVKEINQSLERAMRAVTEREIGLREIAFQMGALQSSQQERHSVDLAELIDEFQGIESGQKDRLLEKLAKARATVENFGEVNLLALNEYEQLQERYDFLTAQEADVTASVHSLQQTIERINRISRTRFAETFEAVNDCFREMFARIFPGGKGHLYLTDSTEMLETGVEMDIQVPGKRARNVTLLSGGEKSLAAIALIFAILQYRPSPFLILDEVDAALDDANVSLFNRLIRDVAKKSQVIMVTHNKLTMEVAERLYGVTTHNQGVSTIISVNLN